MGLVLALSPALAQVSVNFDILIESSNATETMSAFNATAFASSLGSRPTLSNIQLLATAYILCISGDRCYEQGVTAQSASTSPLLAIVFSVVGVCVLVIIVIVVWFTVPRKRKPVIKVRIPLHRVYPPMY